MTPIDRATAHAEAEIRAGRLCTEADLARLFGITPYSGESCRRMAEDRLAAERPKVKPVMKSKPNSTTGLSGNYKRSPAYKAAMERERIDGFARSLPRQPDR
jgi:hypothetical protein